ncbi:MAG: hypothetical protein M3N10_01125 [Actinomycetota bacterium]|nr:hypothetical protein [Actinomycetota bacterium]HZY64784.1 hypothetical protein [Rubrobacteraceae bacterium]
MRSPKEDYRKKATQEALGIARRLKQAGHPAPLGNPASGVMVVLDQPVGPRVIDALERSLESIKLPEAYVTWSSTNLLQEEVLTFQPSILVAIGPGAHHEIDALEYPLSRNSFSEATPGAWFSWTNSVSGLSLPALTPALSDDEAKRKFWRAFLALQEVSNYRL